MSFKDNDKIRELILKTWDDNNEELSEFAKLLHKAIKYKLMTSDVLVAYKELSEALNFEQEALFEKYLGTVNAEFMRSVEKAYIDGFRKGMQFAVAGLYEKE